MGEGTVWLGPLPRQVFDRGVKPWDVATPPTRPDGHTWGLGEKRAFTPESSNLNGSVRKNADFHQGKKERECFLLVEFSRPEYWSGQPFPSPGDLPDPGVEPTSPALQADSLPCEPPGQPENALGKAIHSCVRLCFHGIFWVLSLVFQSWVFCK